MAKDEQPGFWAFANNHGEYVCLAAVAIVIALGISIYHIAKVIVLKGQG